MKDKFIQAHMNAAFGYAKLSYCERRKVGCIVVKDDSILSYGYNGTHSGEPNVCENEYGETLPGTLHAEFNALSKLMISTESSRGADLFTTTLPCPDCADLIIRAKINHVYYHDTYSTQESIEKLMKHGIHCTRVILNDR